MPLWNKKRNSFRKTPPPRRRLRIERLEDRLPLAAIGDMMRTTVAVDVRSQPGFASPEIPTSSTQYPFYSGSAPTGSLGAVIEGPRSQDARTWWRVDFGPGKYAGWVTQDVLTATTIPYVRGIDVSHWQSQINWTSVKNFGIEFAFMKATESIDFIDPRFQYNVTNSRNAGVLVGFYHFANFLLTGDIAGDARAEAAHFVSVAGPHIRAPGLPPVLDVEGRGLGTQAPNKAAISAWTRAWLAEVERLTGVRPMIYSNSDWAKNYLEADLAQYELWHARWTRNLDQPPLPTDPGIWAPHWTVWQYTSNSRVPGIAASTPGVLSDVDGNVFKGTLADLQAWARNAVPDTIPPAVGGVSVSPTSIVHGQTATIGWTATDHVTVDHIGLYLYQNGLPVDTRPYVSGGTVSGQLNANAGNLPNTGSYAWTVPETLPAGVYQVKVVAWDAAGNSSPHGTSSFSNAFSVTNPPLTPVSDLTASATAANQVRLSWTDSVVAEDGFYVERSTDGTTYTQVATLGAGQTSYDDPQLQSSRQYFYRILAYRGGVQGPASNVASAATPQLVQITGTSMDDVYRVVRDGTLLKVYENTEPVGQPTYSSELSALEPTLTINTLGGDDTLMVYGGQGLALGVALLNYHAGTGANSLLLGSGSARIDSTVEAGGTLDSNIQQGADLTTDQLNQNGLTIGAAARVTLSPGGSTGRITSLILGPGARLDITDNALVIDYSGTSPAATVRSQIISGRGGAGLGKGWNGLGITSSTAAQANATAPDSRSVGYAENANLPLGPYTIFRGQAVDLTSILIAYTRTADANLDGVVNNDDVTVVGANFSPGASKPAWSLGDFEYNGSVDNDDVTLLGVFYQGNPPLPAPPPELSAEAVGGGMASGEVTVFSFPSSAWESRRAGTKLRFANVPSNAAATIAAAPFVPEDTSRSFEHLGSQAELGNQSYTATLPNDDEIIDLLAQSIAADRQSHALEEMRLVNALRTRARLYCEILW